MKLTKEISPLWVVPVVAIGALAVAVNGNLNNGQQALNQSDGTLLLILLVSVVTGLRFNTKLSKVPGENYNKPAAKLWNQILIVVMIGVLGLAIYVTIWGQK